jgi:hypothetical protein
MRPCIKPGSEGLTFPKTMGRKRVSARNRKAAIIAKAAPEELDGVPEEQIHDLIEIEIESFGLPYLSFRTRYYHWLKRMAAMGEHTAMEMLAALKDVPDIIILDKSQSGGSRALCLELKRDKGTARKGQQSFAEKVGGTITKGFSRAQEAVRSFCK